MFDNDSANRFVSAALSVMISAAFFAYAIIPATPTLATGMVA
ncbi:MAG: enoyl-CoA hydratase [Erythrobacter sp.]